MIDDKTKRGRPNRDFISLEQEHEVQDWAESLGCSEQELRAAVRAVGNSAKRVEISNDFVRVCRRT